MDPTLSKHFLRWILLCPNTFCDGSYFVQTLFAMDPTLSKHFLRWILLCPNTFCDGSYFVQTLFAMDPTLSKHFLRWILLCPNTFCDGSYFAQTLFAMDPTLSKHFLRWDLPKSISKRFKWDWQETKDLSQTIWGILCHLSQMDVVEMLFWNSILRWIWVRLISKALLWTGKPFQTHVHYQYP